MQFHVPQFIEVEDKIFGPFSFRQFLYLLGGAGLSFIIYKVLPVYIAPIFILPVLAFAGALAFYKINNKPFIFTAEAAVRYFLSSKLYLWKKTAPKQGELKAPAAAAPNFVPKLSDSKLKDLSWSLDVLDINRGR